MIPNKSSSKLHKTMPYNLTKLNHDVSSKESYFTLFTPKTRTLSELDIEIGLNRKIIKNSHFKKLSYQLQNLFQANPTKIKEIRQAFSLAVKVTQEQINSTGCGTLYYSVNYYKYECKSNPIVKDLYENIIQNRDIFHSLQVICSHKNRSILFNNSKFNFFSLNLTHTAEQYIQQIMPRHELKITLDNYPNKPKPSSDISDENFSFLGKGSHGKTFLVKLNNYPGNFVVIKYFLTPVSKRTISNASIQGDADRFNELMHALNCPHYATAFSYKIHGVECLVTPYIEGKEASALERMYCVFKMKKMGFVMHDDKIVSNFITDNFDNTVVIDVDLVANNNHKSTSPRTSWVNRNYGKGFFGL